MDREKKRLEQEAQDRLEREEAQRRAEQDRMDRERRRLEDLRERIETAKKEGPKYANKIRDLTWSLAENMNPMTEEKEYTVSSTQPNGSGAVAIIKGACLKNQVVFDATLKDANDPTRPLGIFTSPKGEIIGNKRINDDPVFATTFPTVKWRNRIRVSTLSFSLDGAESADTTWRALAQVETSLGTV